jgi:hypothetical protein
MTVGEIVKKYLQDNGFDGLCSYECGCELDDLFACGGDNVFDCSPGYKVPCDPETCPADGKCKWHISEEKPKEVEKT